MHKRAQPGRHAGPVTLTRKVERATGANWRANNCSQQTVSSCDSGVLCSGAGSLTSVAVKREKTSQSAEMSDVDCSWLQSRWVKLYTLDSRCSGSHHCAVMARHGAGLGTGRRLAPRRLIPAGKLPDRLRRSTLDLLAHDLGNAMCRECHILSMQAPACLRLPAHTLVRRVPERPDACWLLVIQCYNVEAQYTCHSSPVTRHW
jgi:hypothetical protein